MDDMVRLILIPRCGSSCTQQDFVKHVLQEPRDTYPPELICEFENISDNFVFLGCEVDWSNRPFQLRLHNDFKTSQKKLRFHQWFSNVPRHICKSCIMGAWNRVHTFCSNFALLGQHPADHRIPLSCLSTRCHPYIPHPCSKNNQKSCFHPRILPTPPFPPTPSV